MESCIYEGQVKHTRTRPRFHSFRYRLFLMYLDLDELDSIFEKRWLWSVKRRALARFRRSDHLGPAEQPLSESVRDLVEAETGTRPDGPIRLLTHLSYFGLCFNPVSFYYCYETDGTTVRDIVAEVSNTPWGETDTYVLPRSMNLASGHSFRFQPTKKMHVSPFMDMDNEYEWCFTQPRGRLTVFMANSKDGDRFFSVSMALKRKEISGLSLARVLTLFPLITAKVVAGIYWEALRLWLKRCPVYAHPDKKNKMAVQSQ
jgi:DUF1365 family protein